MTLRTRGARLLARAALGGLLATGGAVALAAPASAAAPAPQPSTAKYEIDFMEDTVMHHNLAIRMAELCLAKATGDDQLKDLCNSVIESQTKQREQLQGWLSTWYGVTPPSDTMLPPNGDETLDKLARYDGEEFDSEMAGTFLKHHYGFLPDADKCRDEAFHKELAGLCDSMYSEQSAQIPQFREVVRESSPRDNYGPKGRPRGEQKVATTTTSSTPAGDHSTYRH